MLNNTQTVNTIEKRTLPTTGLITIRKLIEFVNEGWCLDDKIEMIIEECEKHNISIFKTSNKRPYWLICLDDFKNIRKDT